MNTDFTGVAEPSVDVAASAAVRADGLGKRYGTTWALRDCTFDVPAGSVAAVVGANGAGKTTLLATLAGLSRPSRGEVVIGGGPATGTADPPGGRVGRVMFVAQDKPLYRQFTATDTLRWGMRLNEVWDQRRALRWLERFDVPLDRPCGKLSGGHQAQVAFALALGACPSVLLLDEPLANLDPLARRDVVAELLAEVHDTGLTVLVSTHLVSELGGVADQLLLLARGRLLVDGEWDGLQARHLQCAGPRADAPPVRGEVVRATHTGQQSSFLVRLPAATAAGRPRVAEPWTARPVTVEDLVLAYLETARDSPDSHDSYDSDHSKDSEGEDVA